MIETTTHTSHSLERMGMRRRIGRWASACLNLNTARNDWMDATSAALDGNMAESIRAIDECIKQLESARWKLAHCKPPNEIRSATGPADGTNNTAA